GSRNPSVPAVISGYAVQPREEARPGSGLDLASYYSNHTSFNSPRRIRATRSFHSAWVSFTVFLSSPMVTPWSVISRVGQPVQAGQRITLIASISFTSFQKNATP